MVDKRAVNPWTWQGQRFTQAWRIEDPATVIFASGQGPIDADGKLVGDGDFETQVRKTFENIQTLLAESGASWADVVKLNVYVTDIGQLATYGRVKAEFISGEQPASTAVGVTALALPGMLVEVEAVAVR